MNTAQHVHCQHRWESWTRVHMNSLYWLCSSPIPDRKRFKMELELMSSPIWHMSRKEGKSYWVQILILKTHVFAGNWTLPMLFSHSWSTEKNLTTRFAECKSVFSSLSFPTQCPHSLWRSSLTLSSPSFFHNCLWWFPVQGILAVVVRRSGHWREYQSNRHSGILLT